MDGSVYTVEAIRSRISPVLRRYGVQSAVLFGSYAKGTASERSDIDLLVDSRLRGLRFFSLVEDVREALDEKGIDLFDVSHVDAGSRIQQEIIATGVKIYGE